MMKGTGWESEKPFTMQKKDRESSFREHPAIFSADSGKNRLLNCSSPCLTCAQYGPYLYGLLHPKGPLE